MGRSANLRTRGEHMKLRLWQVDAFAQRPFGGNPAAIVPLEHWLPDNTMQAIANENNVSETAFFVPRGAGDYDLRWFTPQAEVALCGHATLASAWVVLNELQPSADMVRFQTKSGELCVGRGQSGQLRMTFPTDPVMPFETPRGYAEALGNALGVGPPDETYMGRYLMALWKDAATIRAMTLG